MSASPSADVLIFLGPPFSGQEAYAAVKFPGYRCVMERTIHDYRTCCSISEVLREIDAGRRVIVISPDLSNRNVRIAYLSRIRAEAGRIITIGYQSFFPEEGLRQCDWGYQWELALSAAKLPGVNICWHWADCVAWWEDKSRSSVHCQASPEDGFDRNYSVQSKMMTLGCRGAYECSAPGLLLLWDAVFVFKNGQWCYRLTNTTAFTRWLKGNPSGRVIVIRENFDWSSDDGVWNDHNLNIHLTELQASSTRPVLTNWVAAVAVLQRECFADRPVYYFATDSSQYDPELGDTSWGHRTIAWLQARHGLSLSTTSLVYSQQLSSEPLNESFFKSAKAAGIKAIDVATLFGNNNPNALISSGSRCVEISFLMHTRAFENVTEWRKSCVFDVENLPLINCSEDREVIQGRLHGYIWKTDPKSDYDASTDVDSDCGISCDPLYDTVISKKCDNISNSTKSSDHVPIQADNKWRCDTCGWLLVDEDCPNCPNTKTSAASSIHTATLFRAAESLGLSGTGDLPFPEAVGDPPPLNFDPTLLVSKKLMTEASCLRGRDTIKTIAITITTHRAVILPSIGPTVVLIAEASGTNKYQVILVTSPSSDGFKAFCSCPAYDEKSYCKHIAATLYKSSTISDGCDNSNAKMGLVEPLVATKRAPTRLAYSDCVRVLPGWAGSQNITAGVPYVSTLKRQREVQYKLDAHELRYYAKKCIEGHFPEAKSDLHARRTIDTTVVLDTSHDQLKPVTSPPCPVESPVKSARVDIQGTKQQSDMQPKYKDASSAMMPVNTTEKQNSFSKVEAAFVREVHQQAAAEAAPQEVSSTNVSTQFTAAAENCPLSSSSDEDYFAYALTT